MEQLVHDKVENFWRVIQADSTRRGKNHVEASFSCLFILCTRSLSPFLRNDPRSRGTSFTRLMSMFPGNSGMIKLSLIKLKLYSVLIPG